MALNRLALRPKALVTASSIPRTCIAPRTRHASTETTLLASAAPSDLELDNTEFTAASTPSTEIIESFNPLQTALARKKQLPSSRYQFRAPRYYRGPLHPHQPPHPSNPTARDFIPGPFSSPRLAQTYDNILSHDLMVLYYQHVPFGTPRPGIKQRLREWDDSSPYYKNRPLRAPRGMSRLDLQDHPINFRNVPRLESISVSCLIPDAVTDSRYTHTAGMIIQAITTQRATPFKAKKSMAAGSRGLKTFAQKRGRIIAVGTTMKGEQMWHFLSTLTSFVLPRVKEWKGVKAKSGDRNGNFTVGLNSDVVELWPEVAVNYDSYLGKMIPGLSIKLDTTATNDRDGKMLLAALGIPFDARGQ